MSVNEELHEHAEHAHDRFSRRAAAAMAMIAAVLAVVAVAGHMTTTEELLAQQKASDQWAYYQAKSLRRYQSEVAHEILAQLPGAGAAQAAARFRANQERYEREGEQIKGQATEFERDSALLGHRALRLHYGEVLLEMAIVLSSLAILTRRGAFLLAGVSSAVIGLGLAASSLLLR
jgi:hypothetical protein